MKKKLELTVDNDLVLGDILNADTFIERLKGYMLQKKPKSKGVLFRDCNSLHSFLMRFDIDLYFLDQDDRLVRIEKKFSKNKTIYVKEASHVLETPVGAINGATVKIGQLFKFD